MPWVLVLIERSCIFSFFGSCQSCRFLNVGLPGQALCGLDPMGYFALSNPEICLSRVDSIDSNHVFDRRWELQ